MAVLQGAKFEIPVEVEAVKVAGDVTQYTAAKISDASTSPCTVTTCGAGEMPYGVFYETVDYSEDGERTDVIRNGIVPMTAGAAISDADVPVKVDASGYPTPCTTDQDVILGKALHTASSGAIVLIDLKLMGSYYATT